MKFKKLFLIGSFFLGLLGLASCTNEAVKNESPKFKMSTEQTTEETVDVTAPVVTAEETYLLVDVEAPLTYAQILKKVKAVDDVDGDVSGSADVLDSTYVPSKPVVGTHDLTFVFNDKAGNKSEITFTIRVFDEDKPIITGTNEYSISYDEKLTLEDIKKEIVVNDNYDEKLVINVVSDTYSEKMNTVGEYKIVFNASDAEGNVSENFEVKINVIDKKAPTITAPKMVQISNKAAYSEDDLKSKIAVIDGYDGIIKEFNIENFKAYASNSTAEGNYELKVLAKDEAGNEIACNVTLAVSSLIEAEEFVYSSYQITVANGIELSKKEIIQCLAHVGEIEESQVVSTKGTINYTEAGEYEYTILLNDDSIYHASINVLGAPEAEEPGFEFSQLFTGEYWSNEWNRWSSKWGWIQWTTVAFGSLVLIAIIIKFRRK